MEPFRVMPAALFFIIRHVIPQKSRQSLWLIGCDASALEYFRFPIRAESRINTAKSVEIIADVIELLFHTFVTCYSTSLFTASNFFSRVIWVYISVTDVFL